MIRLSVSTKNVSKNNNIAKILQHIIDHNYSIVSTSFDKMSKTLPMLIHLKILRNNYTAKSSGIPELAGIEIVFKHEEQAVITSLSFLGCDLEKV